MVSHHSAKFDGDRRCDSGDVMFLVVKEQIRLNPSLLFI